MDIYTDERLKFIRQCLLNNISQYNIGIMMRYFFESDNDIDHFFELIDVAVKNKFFLESVSVGKQLELFNK